MTYLRVASSMGFPELTLEAAAELANRHGLDGIELRSLAGTIDLSAYFTATYGSPENLAAQKPAVPVTAFCTSLKAASATEADREGFLRLIPWAEALGAPWLRVFDGHAALDATAAANVLRWWRELRARHGWRTDIMIETHDSLLTGEKILRFLAQVPEAVIRWDSHHTWRKGGEDPVATWRAIKAHVVSIDVKDSVSQPSARHPCTYVLPGEGEFPMAPLRAVLQVEYSGPISLEWEKLWHPYLPPVDDALAVARDRGWW